MNLYQASNQWSSRPNDERFWTVRDLHQACTYSRTQARTTTVAYRDLRAQAQGTEVLLVGPKGNPAALTHWAFGQLSQRAGAPPSYLRTLTPELATACINQGLEHRQDDEQASLLFHQNGRLLTRAMVGTGYTRIWGNDITSRLLDLEAQGWRVPPARPAREGQESRPATAADVLRVGQFGLSINVGDPIAAAGLYASDHDLFVFMVKEDITVDGGDGDVLSRGFFMWNSEVGATSFGCMKFLYDHVCGNHIVWGARDVSEIRIRHVGNADERAFAELQVELLKYADSSVAQDRARIMAAKAHVLGATKEAVLDAVFGLPRLGVPRIQLGAAYDLAVEHEASHGAPNTAWGMASGLTRLSQTLPYADERTRLDRAAGKVLEVAF